MGLGGVADGWSGTWAVAQWSCLGDGDKAWETLRLLMRNSTKINLLNMQNEGVRQSSRLTAIWEQRQRSLKC